jgi:DNA-binding MurR/RpiR family transcriptional regulator
MAMRQDDPARSAEVREGVTSLGTEAGPSPPRSFEELAERLRELLPRLSSAQRQLARRVLGNPEDAAFQSVKDRAEAAGVNQSTVVRFAQTIGLPGFPALRRLCEEHLARQAQLVRRFDELATLETTPRDFLRDTVELDRHNLSRTFARLDLGMWNEVVRALSGARAVYVLGLRKSYAPAYLLWYLLQLTRDQVHSVTPGMGTLIDQLRRIGPEDACVALGIHRYAQDTVAAMEMASDAGALTVALTDNAASPLAGLARWTVLIDTASAGVLRSMTAFVAVVQALASAVAAHRGVESREAFAVEEAFLERFHVYVQDAPPGQAGGR